MEKEIEFRYEIGDIIKDNKRHLEIIDRKILKNKHNHNVKYYKYKCLTCGYDCGEHYKDGKLIDEFWKPEWSIVKGKGCSCCCNPSQIVVVDINSMWKTDYWMIELGVTEEWAKTHNSKSNKKANCICPNCGGNLEKYAYAIYQTKSIGCVCGDGFSIPEKFINYLLKEIKLEFETQYSPDYLIREENGKKSRKYSDFYLPKHNVVIEVDGILGHKDGKVHGYSKKSIRECIKVDNWKDEQHGLHGIETIRINCFESELGYIKENILNSDLSKLFNMSQIDWEDLFKQAWKSNKKKEVCNYWNENNEHKNATDLAKIFGLNRCTIARWLRFGNEIGWCKYSGDIETKKSSSKVGKKRAKRVCVYLNDCIVGRFNSARELDEKSLDVFGVKMDYKSISMVCNGKTKTHRGYVIKFDEEVA